MYISLNYTVDYLRIHPENYFDLAKKHCTSKLNAFDDLRSIATFGFRGEALNSLCELSGNFHVSTKQENESIGSTLQYARDGRSKYINIFALCVLFLIICIIVSLQSQGLVARSTGTTVLVQRLFESLPVRRGDFIRY